MNILGHHFEFWFIVSTVEGIIITILFLTLFYLNTGKKISKIEKYKKVDVDLENVFLSINKSKDLYKTLSRKCHPDLFVGEEIQPDIELLFKEITSHRRNYKELEKIKKRAQNEFGMRF